MKVVVQFSGGVGSWGASRRAIEEYGRENTTLLFADTLIEDEDLYRFLDDASESLGVPITRISDGRTPWEVFRDVRYIGNTRADPCSMVLKRDLLRAWINEHCDPKDTHIALGIDWTEEHRYIRAKTRWEPYTLIAPLCQPPYVEKDTLLAELELEGIRQPRLYSMGFPHNNCGGFCVKAGQAQFKLLLEKMPERYAEHEHEEQVTRVTIGKNVAILRDRRGGKTKPMTMKTFRERIEAGKKIDEQEWGGCGCAVD